MYRDFIYLDSGRVESIIAQLNEGAVEEVIEGRTTGLEGKMGLAAGVLSSFLPLEVGGQAGRSHLVQSSKVLHDYAFQVALRSLQDNGLCLEVDDWEPKELPIPDAAFIVVRGRMSILDYALLKNLAEHENTIDKLLGGSTAQRSSGKKNRPSTQGQRGVIKQMWAFVEALMGDSLQIRFTGSNNLVFSGPLTREHLRENTRDLIFKHGGQPQGGWTMLAQVSQITLPGNKLDALAEVIERFQGVASERGNINSASDLLNLIVEVLNAFQEAMASVTYPAISVTPVAVYRELESLE